MSSDKIPNPLRHNSGGNSTTGERQMSNQSPDWRVVLFPENSAGDERFQQASQLYHPHGQTFFDRSVLTDHSFSVNKSSRKQKNWSGMLGVRTGYSETSIDGFRASQSLLLEDEYNNRNAQRHQGISIIDALQTGDKSLLQSGHSVENSFQDVQTSSSSYHQGDGLFNRSLLLGDETLFQYNRNLQKDALGFSQIDSSRFVYQNAPPFNIFTGNKRNDEPVDSFAECRGGFQYNMSVYVNQNLSLNSSYMAKEGMQKGRPGKPGWHAADHDKSRVEHQSRHDQSFQKVHSMKESGNRFNDNPSSHGTRAKPAEPSISSVINDLPMVQDEGSGNGQENERRGGYKRRGRGGSSRGGAMGRCDDRQDVDKSFVVQKSKQQGSFPIQRLSLKASNTPSSATHRFQTSPTEVVVANCQEQRSNSLETRAYGHSKPVPKTNAELNIKEKHSNDLRLLNTSANANTSVPDFSFNQANNGYHSLNRTVSGYPQKPVKQDILNQTVCGSAHSTKNYDGKKALSKSNWFNEKFPTSADRIGPVKSFLQQRETSRLDKTLELDEGLLHCSDEGGRSPSSQKDLDKVCKKKNRHLLRISSTRLVNRKAIPNGTGTDTVNVGFYLADEDVSEVMPDIMVWGSKCYFYSPDTTTLMEMPLHFVFHLRPTLRHHESNEVLVGIYTYSKVTRNNPIFDKMSGPSATLQPINPSTHQEQIHAKVLEAESRGLIQKSRRPAFDMDSNATNTKSIAVPSNVSSQMAYFKPSFACEPRKTYTHKFFETEEAIKEQSRQHKDQLMFDKSRGLGSFHNSSDSAPESGNTEDEEPQAVGSTQKVDNTTRSTPSPAF